MIIPSVLNVFICTCDTDNNAKLDTSELGTAKCQTVQHWILAKTISSFEFGFIKLVERIKENRPFFFRA